MRVAVTGATGVLGRNLLFELIKRHRGDLDSLEVLVLGRSRGGRDVRRRAEDAVLSDGLPYGKMLAEAAVGFVVCGSLQEAHDGQLSYMLQDCSAAIENILIAVHAIGLGACWLGVHPREDRIKHVRSLLKVPAGIVPLAVIAVGRPAEKKQARTRYAESKVHYERW